MNAAFGAPRMSLGVRLGPDSDAAGSDFCGSLGAELAGAVLAAAAFDSGGSVDVLVVAGALTALGAPEGGAGSALFAAAASFGAAREPPHPAHTNAVTSQALEVTLEASAWGGKVSRRHLGGEHSPALRFEQMASIARRDWGAGFRSPEATERLRTSLDYCWRFFVGEAGAQKAVSKLVSILEAENLPYAVIGALALNEYGHKRVTVDVDLVMREEDLQTFKRHWLGRGYAERGVGTGKLIDTELGVHIDVLSTGRFPGDDKPKPIAFPDPVTTAIRGEPFALLPIERWIELKLASGIVAAHRGKDLIDVQELIRSAGLRRELAQSLHPWVRDKFLELWTLAQVEDPF